MKHNRVLLFIIWTYLCFWAGITLIGILMLQGAPDYVATGLQVICAWVPTLVFLALFHKLLPKETSRRSYIKKLLTGRRIGGISAMIVLVQSGLFFLAVFVITSLTGEGFTSLFQFNMVLLGSALLTTLINGATGEELGWRGFLHFELTNKYGIIKGSFFVGVFWSFWHTPLWFLTSGYKGWLLLFFIIAFITSNISASVMIGILYDKKKNLLIPVLIHYLFNFWAEFYTGDRLYYIGVLAVFYLICAVIMGICYQRKNRVS